jgi:hypothetical protein
MKQVVLVLNEDMLIWLRRIITDEDRDEAMEFIRKVIEPRVKEAERSSGMQRSFDAGSPPRLTGGTVG